MSKAANGISQRRDIEELFTAPDVYQDDADAESFTLETVCSNSSGWTLASSGTHAFDWEQSLKQLMEKSDERDILRRELGVGFRDLKVSVLSPTQGDNTIQPTLGSVLNPFNIPTKISTWRHPETKDILSGFEGVVKPREMLLVLGRPGSGCSTLLKTLANERAEYHSVTGEVHYDAFTPEEIEAYYRGDVVYCPEDDIHFPSLTVRQTLNFAATTRTPHKRLAADENLVDNGSRFALRRQQSSLYKERVNGEKTVTRQETREQSIARMTDLLTSVFGLKHVLDTKVGDASIRGVSGGEKKRVSIAEALATRALIGSWDNSTRGLDSSTALEYIRALRTATDLMNLTTIVSIYQASESIYAYFDKVCVINDGRMVYFGKAADARQYFIDMGYQPKERQTTADFLVAVTDPQCRGEREGMAPPRTADEMAKAFRRSLEGRRNRADIQQHFEHHAHLPPPHLSATLSRDDRNPLPASIRGTPKDPYLLPANPSYVMRMEKKEAYNRSVRMEKASNTCKRSPYTISVPMQVRAVMKRRVQILRGAGLAQCIQLLSSFFQAIILSTIFFRVSKSTLAFFSRTGIFFYALIFFSLTAMAEISSLYSQVPIVSRHQRAAMYHPFIEALASTLVDVPISFAMTFPFCLVLYEMADLQQSVGRFLTFFTLIFAVTISMKALFLGIASSVGNEPTAQALAGVLILILTLCTGYTIPRPNIVGMLRWVTYINPLYYGMEALTVNEFHTLNGTCASLVPAGPGYQNVSLENRGCTMIGSMPGQASVDGNRFARLAYGFEYNHLWRNLGLILAIGIFFICLYLFFAERQGTTANGGVVTRFARIGSCISLEKPHSKSPSVSGHGHKRTKSVHFDEEALRDRLQKNVFTWQNLRYTVALANGTTRQLLDDVSGYVAPGKLTALMGESGAGKTTILNVLAQRVGTGVISGHRFVNGQALPSDFQAQTGYCQQMDTHLAETTVREALLFSAKLRQPTSVPLSEKESYVDTCLAMCGLEEFADAIVGTLGVEQKKRVTIGVELAAKPKLLLFLDEPTSGLDAQSAWAIVQFLRSLAERGQAILCTIHQPSAELVQSFDRLLLLKKGGQTVYFGDIGPHCDTLMRYFEKNGARTCGNEENPAEWMLDVIGAGATASSDIDWANAWKKSAESQGLAQELENIHASGREREAVKAMHTSDFAVGWFYQVKTLLGRAFLAYWRNPSYLVAKLMLNIFAGLFTGLTFFKAKDSIQGTQDKIFAVYMAICVSIPVAYSLMDIFVIFRNVYEIRERPSKMYSWTAWATSQLIVEVPYNILGSLLFCLCWYWLVGYPTSRAPFTFLAYGLVYPVYYTSFALAIAAMSPNSSIACTLFSTLFSFVLTFNGMLEPFSQLGWWVWMYRVSPITYILGGIAAQVTGQQDIRCASTEFTVINPSSGQTCQKYLGPFISASGGYLNNPDATAQCLYCPVHTTDQFIFSQFNMEYSQHWRNLGIVLGVTAVNVAAMYILMWNFRIRSSCIRPWVRKQLAKLKGRR